MIWIIIKRNRLIIISSSEFAISLSCCCHSTSLSSRIIVHSFWWYDTIIILLKLTFLKLKGLIHSFILLYLIHFLKVYIMTASEVVLNFATSDIVIDVSRFVYGSLPSFLRCLQSSMILMLKLANLWLKRSCRFWLWFPSYIISLEIWVLILVCVTTGIDSSHYILVHAHTVIGFNIS